MNLRANGVRSTVTLRDGRQLEVEGLRVDVEEASGRLVGERSLAAAVDASSESPRGAELPKPVTFPSTEILRVEMRTGRGKGAAIGGISGAVVGLFAGGGIGYAAAPTQDCSGPYVPTECASTNGINQTSGLLIGGVVGAIILGVTGLLVGRRGVERTFVFDRSAGGEGASPPGGGTGEPALSLGP